MLRLLICDGFQFSCFGIALFKLDHIGNDLDSLVKETFILSECQTYCHSHRAFVHCSLPLNVKQTYAFRQSQFTHVNLKTNTANGPQRHISNLKCQRMYDNKSNENNMETAGPLKQMH